MTQVKFDPVAELMECLTVLMEYVDTADEFGTPIRISVDQERETVTAAWQTVELVQSLLAEHQHVTQLMNNVLAERNAALQAAQQAKGATGLVIANAGQARQYIREQGL